MTWNTILFDENGLIKDPRTLPANGSAVINFATASGTATFEFSVSQTIPAIVLAIGETHDMSQYINDPNNIRVSTSIADLGSIASYSSETELLTGLEAGTTPPVTLEVVG